MHLLCSHTQLNDLSHFILCTYRVVEESMNILDLYRFLSSLPLKWFKVLSRECMSIMFNDLRKKIVFEEKKFSWLYVEACKHEIIRSIYVFFPQHWVSKAILITKYWFSAQIFFYFFRSATPKRWYLKNHLPYKFFNLFIIKKCCLH